MLDATNAWSKLITDEAALAGLPPSALGLARQTAEQRDQAGWLLTLDFPSYYPVMTYADDRVLRREVYEAYQTRASDRGPHAGQYDNSAVMEKHPRAAPRAGPAPRLPQLRRPLSCQEDGALP